MVKATLRSGSKSGNPPAVGAVIDVESVRVTGSAPAPSESTSSIMGEIEAASVTTVSGTTVKEAATSSAPAEALQRVSENRAVQPNVQNASGAFSGEFSAEDLSYPTLSIVQGSSGTLVEMYDQGDLVLGDQLLSPGPKKGVPSLNIRVVPVSVQKSFRENLTQDQISDGEMPRFARTIAEVESLGGSTQWIGGQKPNWQPSAKIALLIERPADCEHPAFSMEVDGKEYALALYYAKTGAYGTTAKVLFNAFHTLLLEPVKGADGSILVDQRTGRPVKAPLLCQRYWHFSWGTVKAGDFNPWRPKLTLIKDLVSDELREFCKTASGAAIVGLAAE